MTEARFQHIAEQIGYLGEEEQAYQLYRKLGQCSCPRAEKAAFALRYWGWTGKERAGASDTIQKMRDRLFVFPPIGEAFLKQFYRLLIPVRAGKVGAHLDFDPYFWNEECYHSEIMSIQYRVRMVSIGIIQYFYHDFAFHAERLDFARTNEASSFWEIELFLAGSGKIYYYEPDAGISGLLSESVMDFFTEMFAFPEARKKGFQSLSREDSLIGTSLLDAIEQQVEAGAYQPREL